MIKKQPDFPARSYRSRESGTVSAAATTITGESRGRRFSRFGPCLFALWKRTAAAEPPPEGTGRGGGKEKGGSAAPPRRSKGPKGDSPRPRPGATKPRGRTTDHRAEDGRGTASPGSEANRGRALGESRGPPEGRRMLGGPCRTIRSGRREPPRRGPPQIRGGPKCAKRTGAGS